MIVSPWLWCRLLTLSFLNEGLVLARMNIQRTLQIVYYVGDGDEQMAELENWPIDHSVGEEVYVSDRFAGKQGNLYLGKVSKLETTLRDDERAADRVITLERDVGEDETDRDYDLSLARLTAYVQEYLDV